jgi:hypothetical protein
MRLDVNMAIRYGCEGVDIENYPELNLAQVKKILEDAQNAGVDMITFYN